MPPSALRPQNNAQNVAAGAASTADLQLQLASLVNGNANKSDLIAGIKGVLAQAEASGSRASGGN
eukprot:6996619-Alexandrium_andersonii.AAC.1